MNEFFNNPNVLVIAGAIVGGVVLIISLLAMIAKFYRRCGADEALVRTGAGGNKVVIGGGIMVYPILHQLQRVSLRSVKLSVERAGRMALVTADKIKANVSTELYIKVDQLIPHLEAGDFEKDEKLRAVTLTEQGSHRIEELLRETGLLKTGSLYDVQNVALATLLAKLASGSGAPLAAKLKASVDG